MTELLARMIKRSRWEEPRDKLDCDGVPADCITDLKTTGNTLSLWKAGSKEAVDLTAAVVAIAGTRTRLDPLELAWVEEDQIKKEKLPTAATPGRTPAEAHRTLHVDLVRLDHARLAKFASILSAALANEWHVKLTREQVRNYLVTAISKGTVPLAELPKALRDEVSSNTKE